MLLPVRTWPVRPNPRADGAGEDGRDGELWTEEPLDEDGVDEEEDSDEGECLGEDQEKRVKGKRGRACRTRQPRASKILWILLREEVVLAGGEVRPVAEWDMMAAEN
jgi:hypothetical protein